MPGLHFKYVVFSFVLFLSACASAGYKKVKSENYNSRVSILVIHHTAGNFKGSLDILTKKSARPVSSHYLVPEPVDDSYKKKKLKVYQLVDEDKRAWHAGRSYWAGKSSLNDHSIGIEIVNRTYCVKNDGSQDLSDNAYQGMSAIKRPQRICFFPDFAEEQIALVIDLVQDILKRHPRISPVNIVGHSDIAPDRKIDPGPRFPWQRLASIGIGAWPDDEVVVKYWQKYANRNVPIKNIQKALSAYGYKIELTGIMDEQSKNVISAFQMHFRPMNVSGRADAETIAILFALVEKYRPQYLQQVLP